VNSDLQQLLQLSMFAFVQEALNPQIHFRTNPTCYRQDSTGVTLEDVDAFRKEQQLAKAKTSNIFARQGWEE